MGLPNPKKWEAFGGQPDFQKEKMTDIKNMVFFLEQLLKETKEQTIILAQIREQIRNTTPS